MSFAGKLYVDHMSQPSRACMIFRRLHHLDDIEEVLVNIAKGATRTKDYLSINPLGKVPFYKETASSLGLPESSAILRYLADKKNVPDHWYPRGDRTLRALVDAAMAWHASTLRIGSMIVVWNLAIVRNLGRQGNHALVEDYGIPTLRSALKDLDAYWLKERKFVAGNDISVADLLIACEVEQLCLLDAVAAITDGRSPSMQTLLDPHQQIQEWLKRVRESCGRQYEEVHKVLRNVRDRMVTHFASKL